MAHGFITSCPTGNPSFPIKAFPGLEVTTAAPIVSGQMISVQTAGYVLAPADSTAQLHAAFITAAGPIWAALTAKSGGMDFDVTVPQGVNGQSYLLFSNCNDTVTDDTVVAGTTHLEVSSGMSQKYQVDANPNVDHQSDQRQQRHILQNEVTSSSKKIGISRAICWGSWDEFDSIDLIVGGRFRYTATGSIRNLNILFTFLLVLSMYEILHVGIRTILRPVLDCSVPSVSKLV